VIVAVSGADRDLQLNRAGVDLLPEPQRDTSGDDEKNEGRSLDP
jgi:hypothetical protein